MRWSKTSKQGILTGMAIFVIAIFVILPQPSFSQEDTNSTPDPNEFTRFEGSEIQNNSVAQQMLERIEESKRILKELQTTSSQITDHELFIEEQRKIAQQYFEKKSESFFKTHEENNPKNSFARFVSGVNATHQAIYWEQFDYMNERVQLARQAKQAMLDNGGTFQEAQSEYIKYASLPRAEMIQYVLDLNIKYGFADKSIQEHFDKYGKLPRYENDGDAQCYGCEQYAKFRDSLIDVEMNPYTITNNTDSIEPDNITIPENAIAFKDPTTSNSNVVFVELASEKKNIPNNDFDDKENKDVESVINKLEEKIDELVLELQGTDDLEKQQEVLESMSNLYKMMDTLKDI